MVEQLTPDQPVSGSIPLVLTFLSFPTFYPHHLYLFPSFSLRALIAQSVEHGANNARVVGSSPTGSIFYFFYLFSLFFYDYLFLTIFLLFFYLFPSIGFMFSLFSFLLEGDLAQW